jgi:ankyrin repeat protein
LVGLEIAQSKSKNSPSPKSIKVAKKLFQDTEIDSLTGQVDTLSLRNKLIVDDSPIKLCKAAHNGDDKVVTTLLTTITQEVIMEPDKNGHTALHHASYKGHKAIVKLLLDKAPQLINATDNNGYTALHFAEQQEFKEIVMLIKMKTLEKQMQLMVLTQEILLQQPALETEILVATVETNNTNTHQLEHLGNILEHQHNDFL